VIRDSNDAITVQDIHGKFLAWNRGAVQMYGWPEAEALAMNVFEMIPEHLRAETREVYQGLFNGENIRSYETKRETHQGRLLDVWITLSVLVDDMQQPVGIATTERDVTERKKTDQRLRFENRGLKALNAWLAAYQPAAATSPTVDQDLCKLLVEAAGYRIAWIGRVIPGEAMTLEPTGWAGMDDGASLSPKWVQNLARRTRACVEAALHNRRPVAIQNIHADPAQKPWRMDAQKLGYTSCIVLPLVQSDRPLGVLVIYAEEPEAFMDPEAKSLMSLAAGISQMVETR
jgi:PAS domain S-box-containing protein